LLDAAPEVVANREYDGKAADIWSLGICLYAMVTGTLPWRNCAGEDLVDEIQTADIEIPLCLSPRLQQLLAHMLDRDTAKRPTIEDVLNAPWIAPHVKEISTAPHIRTATLELGRFRMFDPVPSSRSRATRMIITRPKNLLPIGASATKPLVVLIRQAPNPPRPRRYAAPQIFDRLHTVR
jgi:serine/threonine protein kinase